MNWGFWLLIYDIQSKLIHLQSIVSDYPRGLVRDPKEKTRAEEGHIQTLCVLAEAISFQFALDA